MKTIKEEKLEKLKKPIELIVSKAREVSKIESNEDAKAATEFLIKLKSKIEFYDNKRIERVKPLNDTVKKLNNDFRVLLDPLKQCEKDIKEAIIEYKTTQDNLRLEEQKRLDEKGLVIKDTFSDSISSASGELRIVKRWTFAVEDTALIPRKYLRVDEDVVNKEIKEGVRNIKGLKIFQEASASVYRDKE